MIYDFQRVLSLRLFAWALISAVAGILLFAFSDPFWRGFGVQAFAWGVIDAVIAVFGLRSALSKIDLVVDHELAKREGHRLARILWVNTGLDVLYILGGWLLISIWARGDQFLVGSGWGIILQGGFLFVFDLLHALSIPRERALPQLDLFPSPTHEAFTLKGGEGAVLLVHGFPGSPDEWRPIAEALNQSGWTTRAMLLPGFGPQFHRLFQQRASGWVDAILEELRILKQSHDPVVLAGFSMGGGLSILAAAQEPVSQLVLLAPFWWESKPVRDALLTAARILLPLDFPITRRAFFSLQRAAESAGVALAGSLSSQEMKDQIRRVRVPLIFLEQFLRFSKRLPKAAAQVAAPVVVIQGRSDDTVLPARTRKLVRWFSSEVKLKEIPGDHFFIQRGNPHLPGLIQAVLQSMIEQKEG